MGLIPHRQRGCSRITWGSESPCNFPPVSCLLPPVSFFNYEIKTQPVKLDFHQALSIDHGLNNCLTCVETQGHSLIIDGKHLKFKNQRNRQMGDGVNKTAKLVINHCLKT
ncbi:MAG: transposase [Okeania sp. SIO2G4]|nr:transposase [Okeania sp. SIO4D6]NEP43458.1 transposase [Okeania sp. SIO2H7]NEP72956.1 transposase [Okeania sp. SIO2G5]NEP94970.1 transposase [Okeania sp. SIO2F5]NEQ92318.1 transposase [Okeania sp. SIO2G4]